MGNFEWTCSHPVWLRLSLITYLTRARWVTRTNSRVRFCGQLICHDHCLNKFWLADSRFCTLRFYHRNSGTIPSSDMKKECNEPLTMNTRTCILSLITSTYSCSDFQTFGEILRSTDALGHLRFRTSLHATDGGMQK